jgi:hypothetical protein
MTDHAMDKQIVCVAYPCFVISGAAVSRGGIGASQGCVSHILQVFPTGEQATTMLLQELEQ